MTDTMRDFIQDAIDAQQAADVRLGRRTTYHASRDVSDLVCMAAGGGTGYQKALRVVARNEAGCLVSEGFVVDNIVIEQNDNCLVARVVCRYDGTQDEACDKLEQCGYPAPDAIAR